MLNQPVPLCDGHLCGPVKAGRSRELRPPLGLWALSSVPRRACCGPLYLPAERSRLSVQSHASVHAKPCYVPLVWACILKELSSREVTGKCPSRCCPSFSVLCIQSDLTLWNGIGTIGKLLSILCVRVCTHAPVVRTPHSHCQWPGFDSWMMLHTSPHRYTHVSTLSILGWCCIPCHTHTSVH